MADRRLQVFYTVAKQLSFTKAAGRLVMEYAERILGISEELDQRVAELTGAVSGRLLLGASTTVAEFILPQILGEFKARYPQVQAHMSVANSETIENRVG